MKRALLLLLISFCGSAVIVALAVARSPLLSFGDLRTMAASIFFVESITPEQLREKYERATHGGDRVRVLIVPGHDNETGGTEFNGIREADMNAVVGEELIRLMSADPLYEPLLVRSRSGYASGFPEYFEEQDKHIASFIAGKKQTMRELVRAGSVHITTGVIHNSAPNAVAKKLYAINKWANDNGVDIVLHIHFNDYPGRPYYRAGRYNGFAVYVPNKQYSNARASRAVGEVLFSQFSRFYVESNLPVEDSGVVEDQELIALGSYNTLDPAGVLVEYGYIYEPRFLDSEVREAALKELAFQTYQGFNRFFGKYGEVFQRFPTALLPHVWQEPLAQGISGRKSVLALQAALALEDVYPPQGQSKRDCPLTGSFGPCTTKAVKGFQGKHGLPQSGTVGPQTIEKLNEKYSK